MTQDLRQLRRAFVPRVELPGLTPERMDWFDPYALVVVEHEPIAVHPDMSEDELVACAAGVQDQIAAAIGVTSGPVRDRFYGPGLTWHPDSHPNSSVVHRVAYTTVYGKSTVYGAYTRRPLSFRGPELHAQTLIETEEELLTKALAMQEEKFIGALVVAQAHPGVTLLWKEMASRDFIHAVRGEGDRQSVVSGYPLPSIDPLRNR